MLFAQSKLIEIKFLLALALAGLFIIFDAHNHSLNFIRNGFAVFTNPLQWVVDRPQRIAQSITLFLRDKNDLLLENQKLREQHVLLNSRLQTFDYLQQENKHLRYLLSTKQAAHTKVMAANVLEVESNRARQLVILNKGTRDGVQVGLPVIDESGVMGQVINVGLMTSTVLLIADSKCAVPVSDSRTGERAILVGTNNIEHLSLINLPKSSTIAVGDVLVTSGLGLRYPEGYPVGKVIEVNHAPGEEFIRVVAEPLASLSRSRWVLLLWPEKEQSQIIAQIHQRLKVLEGLG